MRQRTQSENSAASVDLTPMLDVVFILLIFFIVTSTFAQEQAIGVEPPPPGSTDPSTQTAIVVEVNQEGLIRVNGRLTDISGVRANMERLRAESPHSGSERTNLANSRLRLQRPNGQSKSRSNGD